jgi:hypothetical protein
MDQRTINYTLNISHSGRSKPSYPIDPLQRKPWSTTCCIPTRHQSAHHRSLSFQTLLYAATYLHFFQCLSVLQRDACPRKLVQLKLSQPIPSHFRCSSSHHRSATSPYLYASIQTAMSICECKWEAFSSNRRGCCFSTTVGFPHRAPSVLFHSTIKDASILQRHLLEASRSTESHTTTFSTPTLATKGPFLSYGFSSSLSWPPANIHRQQQTTSSTSPSSIHHIIRQYHTGQLSASSPTITDLVE